MLEISKCFSDVLPEKVALEGAKEQFFCKTVHYKEDEFFALFGSCFLLCVKALSGEVVAVELVPEQKTAKSGGNFNEAKSCLSSSLSDSIQFNSIMGGGDEEMLARRVLKTLRTDFLPSGNKCKWAGSKKLDFAAMVKLCENVKKLFAREKTMLSLHSPVFVFGDIHGNYHDLYRYSQTLGILRTAEIVPSSFLFLGDYVDRGLDSVEVLAFLFAMKCLYPNKVFLLRGNHETLETTNHPKTKNPLCRSCQSMFGPINGTKMFDVIIDVFGYLPICALIDNNIFCTHGGIPRVSSPAWKKEAIPEGESLLSFIENIPRPPKYCKFPSGSGGYAGTCVYDLLSADPVSAMKALKRRRELEGNPVLKKWDEFPPCFYPNFNRGSDDNPCAFDAVALDNFLKETGCTRLFRAHEMRTEGVQPFHDKKLFTVFSTSNYCDHNSSAILLVHNDDIKPIRIIPT